MSEETPRRDSYLKRLLTGRSDIDFIGRSRLWLYITLAIIVVSLAAPFVRGINFGIEFTGGSSFTVSDATADYTVADLQDALAELGVTDAIVQVVDDGAGAQVSTPSLAEIEGVEDLDVAEAVAEVTGVDVQDVSVSSVGPRWGQAITRQALQGLVVFLALVVVYISFRFEWRMAVAALVSVLHDIIATVGLYALVGFPVTPASAIALLTILGYSLYDTVVVFDRVKEDTAKITSVSTESYGQIANHALNEVLVRSLSTSITSVFPVASLLFIGSTLLGAATLSDLALALLIGMLAGTYSSIFVATPLLVWLKEKDPKMRELKARAARASAS